MVHPPLDLLTRRSFPDLAAALRARAGQVLERWGEAVRRTLPAADELTFAQLRDNCPCVLEQIADALAATGPAAADGVFSISAEHGSTRFHQSFNLNELLIEYHLLRRAVLEEVADQLGRDLTGDESLAVNLGIDVSMRQASVAFSDHQTRQLQAANEAQSKYLSFLSHDLRGGLNGVFLMIEVLKRELAGQSQLAETLQDLDMMRRSILDTVGTMDRFLHAERFRKGKVQVNPGPVNLHSVLGEIGAQFSYQAKNKGIEIKVDVPRTAETVSDRELLGLIVQNLVANAVKYTSKGTVRVGASPAGADGTWQVEVADQGPGIAADKLSELFDSFTRGLTYGQSGVGLGLTIAHHAADLLGARLWAESKPGQGSTFFVRLPEPSAEAEVGRANE